MIAPGVAEFDPAVTMRLRRGIDRWAAGMPCPVAGHDHVLEWRAGGRTKGTVACPEVPVYFRVSPTYICVDYLDNFICDRELVAGLAGAGKAETHRLGHENSEDALSFNVFRSLQRTRRLDEVGSVFRPRVGREPDLVLWGLEIGGPVPAPCEPLRRALNQIEPHHRRQTEPDVILRDGDDWTVIEAKLTSPTTGLEAAKAPGWIERYTRVATKGVLDRAALRDAEPKQIPEQLLRNVVVASLLAPEGRASVRALVRARDAGGLQERVSRFLAADCSVDFGVVTWEALYGRLSADDPVRAYMRNKSVSLRKAFEVV